MDITSNQHTYHATYEPPWHLWLLLCGVMDVSSRNFEWCKGAKIVVIYLHYLLDVLNYCIIKFF